MSCSFGADSHQPLAVHFITESQQILNLISAEDRSRAWLRKKFTNCVYAKIVFKFQNVKQNKRA